MRPKDDRDRLEEHLFGDDADHLVEQTKIEDIIEPAFKNCVATFRSLPKEQRISINLLHLIESQVLQAKKGDRVSTNTPDRRLLLSLVVLIAENEVLQQVVIEENDLLTVEQDLTRQVIFSLLKFIINL